ncbi:MAG: hypothetical protein ACREX9_10385 [Gammaproteobacteria bacterium]
MDNDLPQMSREQLIADIRRLVSGIRQHASTGTDLARAVLAPSGTVGAVAGGHRPTAGGAGLAAVPPRLHPLPAVARRAGPAAPRNSEPYLEPVVRNNERSVDFADRRSTRW